jgi:hypothetical protein
LQIFENYSKTTYKFKILFGTVLNLPKSFPSFSSNLVFVFLYLFGFLNFCKIFPRQQPSSPGPSLPGDPIQSITTSLPNQSPVVFSRQAREERALPHIILHPTFSSTFPLYKIPIEPKQTLAFSLCAATTPPPLSRSTLQVPERERKLKTIVAMAVSTSPSPGRSRPLAA